MVGFLLLLLNPFEFLVLLVNLLQQLPPLVPLLLLMSAALAFVPVAVTSVTLLGSALKLQAPLPPISLLMVNGLILVFLLEPALA